jgi:hypothetical protein
MRYILILHKTLVFACPETLTHTWIPSPSPAPAPSDPHPHLHSALSHPQNSKLSFVKSEKVPHLYETHNQFYIETNCRSAQLSLSQMFYFHKNSIGVFYFSISILIKNLSSHSFIDRGKIRLDVYNEGFFEKMKILKNRAIILKNHSSCLRIRSDLLYVLFAYISQNKNNWW